jgi:hypothetical protein
MVQRQRRAPRHAQLPHHVGGVRQGGQRRAAARDVDGGEGAQEVPAEAALVEQAEVAAHELVGREGARDPVQQEEESAARNGECALSAGTWGGVVAGVV